MGDGTARHPPPAAAAPTDAAGERVPPALREMDAPWPTARPEETLERWRTAYRAQAADARAMGVPASAVPILAPDADAAALRAARDHLAGLVASFLSAGL